MDKKKTVSEEKGVLRLTGHYGKAKTAYFRGQRGGRRPPKSNVDLKIPRGKPRGIFKMF